MKRYLLIGALAVLAIGFFTRQDSNFSHRISFRNDHGDVIATAQIALPEASFFSPDSFTGKWMLETWTDEFPKEATSAENYRATRKADALRVDLNPPWADNNVVLNSKQEGLTYEGEWCHQMRGPGAMGHFEIVPISDSEPRARLVNETLASLEKGTGYAH